MPRPIPKGTRLVIASHNPGKVREFGDLLRPFGLDVVSAEELGLPEPDETETSFIGNARLKALAAATAAKLPALSDDSGLEVEALGGAPGIYSARWAGPTKDFSFAMARVRDELVAKNAWTAPGPRANFTAALCLAFPDGDSEAFEGKRAIQRHQAAYAALGGLMGQIHALGLHTYTPAEWEADASVPDSPRCRGGSKHDLGAH